MPGGGPPAAAATPTADGEGLSKTLVGRAAYFSIYASDASGARATRGGEAVGGAIRGPSPATRSIRDNGDGTYAILYEDGDSELAVPRRLMRAPGKVGRQLGMHIDPRLPGQLSMAEHLPTAGQAALFLL